jgi:hypothetical protein
VLGKGRRREEWRLGLFPRWRWGTCRQARAAAFISARAAASSGLCSATVLLHLEDEDDE